MSSEAAKIVRLAEPFLAEYAPNAMSRERREEALHGREILPTGADLMKLSEKVAELLSDECPSTRALRTAAKLFDEISKASWPPDSFGERYEVCSSLAFVAWRHASWLGLAVESQEWLRVLDVIAQEPFAALECIEAFFELASELQTVERARQFLSKPEDVFLALASLRIHRNLNPRRVLGSAAIVYSVCVDAPGFKDFEREFFLGEAAWLAAHGGRFVSSRLESQNWLRLALRHFGACCAREPLLAKARLASSIASRDRHDVNNARTEIQGLGTLFTTWNMDREALICQLMECVLDKETGASNEALTGFRRLVKRLRQVCVFDVLAGALPPYAELRFKGGETDAAFELLQEAIQASAGMPILECSVFLSFAELHLGLGNDAAAILWCRAAVEKAAGAMSIGPLAYTRVWLADLLLRSKHVDEAYQEILLAIPTLKAEEMMPEMAYAATLLARIGFARTSNILIEEVSSRRP